MTAKNTDNYTGTKGGGHGLAVLLTEMFVKGNEKHMGKGRTF